jgi:NADP-dependent 3-hydroxy acid dehydrogenase YdfG
VPGTRYSSDGRVLLITGASSGIGAATARRAVQAGDRVVLAARRQRELEALVSELGADRALAVPCDVTEWDQVTATVEAALERFGRIDVVFANAGFGATRGFTQETVEHWRSMVLTNVLGVALTIRATLPHLLERGDGHYVLTSSIAGRRSLPGSLYSATKFAVTGIGQGLRSELREMHQNNAIRVTLMEPGGVETPFFDNPAEGRLEPDDVAGAVMWALGQPPHVDVSEVLILPTAQGAIPPASQPKR